MMGAVAHLDSCDGTSKSGLLPKDIEVIKKIKAAHKEPNYGAAKVRHAMMDYDYTIGRCLQ